MRPGLVALSLAFAGLVSLPAPPGRAAPEEPREKPAARVRAPTNLRGAVGPDASARPAAPTPPIPVFGAAATAPRSPIPRSTFGADTAPASAAPDAGECRSTCAHAYYFCLSGPESIGCADTWSQCATGCDHPPLTIDQ